jgi:sugar lactone lactonase YvrE
MYVDMTGRAYVGSFGFDLDAELEKRGPQSVLNDHPKASLVCVDIDGTVVSATEGLSFPNGMVMTSAPRMLVVAETLGLCLTAFEVCDNGSLVNQHQWADVGMRTPDGICLSQNGCIWVANAIAPECVLVEKGGRIVARVTTTQNCIACALGGLDGDQLFILTAPSSREKIASKRRDGKIEVAVLPSNLL